MFDIHGNPEVRRVEVPVFPGPAREDPYPGLCLLVELHAGFALAYVAGLVPHFPRTGGHDAALAAAFVLSGAAWAARGPIRRVPGVGAVLCALPGLALVALPFALDAYLMAGR